MNTKKVKSKKHYNEYHIGVRRLWIDPDNLFTLKPYELSNKDKARIKELFGKKDCGQPKRLKKLPNGEFDYSGVSEKDDD